MTAERVEQTARMLPDTTPLVPMKAQSPEQVCQSRLTRWRNIEPNLFADDFGQFVMPRQQRPQTVQDRFRGQASIRAMFYKRRLLGF